ncbi:hypothetical protein B0H13DRAFT_1852169 [Mycena leptocephala]|nr:hypothetical protein B0H13DRAFT_1852169 [Mycena leptocephala]
MSPTETRKRKASSRTTTQSSRQRAADENKADDAAKTTAKKKAQQAVARKEKRSNNNSQAAALRDATNTSGSQSGEPLSAEAQIADLTARLKSAKAQVHELDRKNKKLTKTVRRARADTTNTNTAIVPIPKPKGKFNIQSAMGLSDNRALFTQLQAGIHGLALEAKIDFGLNWSHQEPSVVAKVLRVAEERHKYLSSERLPPFWATSALLQRYIDSKRAYESGKANPTSGVNRRRERVTNVGRLEAQASRGRRNSRIVTSPVPEDDQNNDTNGTPTPEQRPVSRVTPASSDESDKDDHQMECEGSGGFDSGEDEDEDGDEAGSPGVAPD